MAGAPTWKGRRVRGKGFGDPTELCNESELHPPGEREPLQAL